MTKLWTGRFNPLFIVQHQNSYLGNIPKYQLCRDIWNDAGHHIDNIDHSKDFEELKEYGIRLDEGV